MEFVCQKEGLAEGVSTVERIVSTRSTLPIIGNILFETTKTGIKLSANNLEMGIELTVQAKVIKDGSVLIPAKTLGGIVAKLPDGEIGFKLKDKGLITITYKKSSFNIHGLPPDEFPQMPKVKDPKQFSLEAKLMTEMLKQTVFATSTSEEKYVLNGVLIETGKSAHESSNLRMVATDGYRLAKRGEKIPGLDVLASAIVPAKALTELLRILQGRGDGDVSVALGAEQVAFRHRDVYLVSRLIQGQFPDYKQVIPKSSEVEITVATSAMLQAAERAAVIASQSANIVKLEVRAGTLTLSAQAPDVGSVEEVVEIESKGKERSSAAFNVRLLADALKVIDDDKVTLGMGESLSPGIIKPKDGPDYTYIVMPIRTKETAD
jgi:DNA polymerase-3 subunit beta